MLILLAIVLLLLLPSPWGVVTGAIALVFGVGEIAYWNSTVKGRRVRAGAETLIGSSGIVVSDCRPDGQIKLRGAVWAARCEAGADAGQAVRVVARSRLVLDVEPETPDAPPSEGASGR